MKLKPLMYRIPATAVLVILAVIVRFAVAPQAVKMPSNYRSVVQLVEQNSFRDAPNGNWVQSTLSAKRVDAAITQIGETLFLQGTLQISFADGSLNFENSALYAVQRSTRKNVAEIGDQSRTGQFLFPAHTKRQTYTLWDPMFIGPRQVLYERDDVLEGLPVYVFHFEVKGLDETTGYSFLADVPEKFLALTDGAGMIWVEPLSGIVVMYQDQGASYFADPKTMSRGADFNLWTEQYTEETSAHQAQLARESRSLIQIFEIWLPGGLLLAGIAWLAASILHLKPKQSTKKKNLA